MASIEVRLAWREPFDWDALTSFLSKRAVPGVEQFDGDEYVRGAIRIRRDTGSIAVSMPAAMSSRAHDICTRARHMFDTDADPLTIAAHLERDPLLRAIVRRHRGIRVPGTWDPFELAVRAIVGQQVTVAGATTTLGRLMHGFGSFPTPAQLATATITGMPAQRAATLNRLAAAVASGDLLLERAASLEDSIAQLTSIKGIGPWTANYIAMRAMREPDAFPAGDLVLQRQAGAKSEKELLRMAERWRPWRAYATMLLWSA